MAYDVGTAVIHVNVAFEGIERQLRNLAEKIGKDLNTQVSENLNDGVNDGLGKATQKASRAAKASGTKLADDFGGSYSRRIREAIARTIRELPKIDVAVGADTDAGRMQAVRRQLLGLFEGDRDFLNSPEAARSLRELHAELDSLSRDAESVQLRLDADAARRTMQSFFDSLETDAERAAKRAAAAQEEELRQSAARLTAIAERQQAQAETAAARAAERAQAQAERVAERARVQAERAAERARVQATREAEKQAAAVQRAAEREAVARLRAEERAERERQKRNERLLRDQEKANERAFREARQFAERLAKEAEREFGATLMGRIRKVFTDAYRQIPDLEVDANTEPAARRLAALRRDMANLGDVDVSVDLSAREALTAVEVLQKELRDLARSSPTIEVRAAAVGAYNELVGIKKLAKDLDGENVRLDVFVDGRTAGQALAEIRANAEVTLHRLGALIVTASSLGSAIVPAAAAAAGAIGFIGTAAAAAAGGIGVMVLGFSGIGDALKAMDAYAKDLDKSQASLARSASQVANATDAIKSAERGLANTRASNATALRRAAQAVEDAERGVARAQQEARQATLDLIRAREEERRANQDLAFDLEGTSLAQRQAALDQADAKRELDRVLANPRSTEEQKEAARIAYEEISLRIRELAVQHERLSAEQQHANKVGIEGSDRVVAARQRERDAVEGVQESQRRLSEAVLAQADQQRQAVFAIAQAQQTLASAQRQLRDATSRESLAGTEVLDTLRERMDALSPAGQRFVAFLYSLKQPMLELRNAAQGGLLPGVQRAIEAVLPYLPAFTQWVGRVAGFLGQMFEKTADLVSTDEGWRNFWGYIGKETVPTLQRLWDIGSNLATALINLFMAFTPFNAPVGEGLVDLTRRFAEWTANLDKNAGFQKFLDYVRENGPRVLEFIKQTAILFGRLVAAAAPIGAIVIVIFTKLFEWINKIPMDVLTIILGTVVLVAAAIGVLATVTAIAAAGSASLYAAAVGALVAWLLILWNTVEPLRVVVTTVIKAIGAVFLWLYDYVIKPVFEGFVWIYNNLIKPTWAGISLVFRVGFAVIQVAFGLFQIGLKILGAAWVAFYTIFIKPWWDKLRPLFQWLGDVWSDHVVPRFKAGVSAFVKNWRTLIDGTKEPIRFIIETVLNKGLLRGYNTIAKAFKVKPDNVQIALEGFAEGGAIRGRGTGTSDANLILASRGEHMWTAKEVRALGGHERMYQLRQAVLDGTLPAFRDGGPIGDGIGDLFNRLKKKAGDAWEGVTDFLSDPPGTLRKLADKLLELLPGDFASSDMGRAIIGAPKALTEAAINKVKGLFSSGEDGGPVPGGGFGSTRMMQILRAQFPGLALYSGFRPGAMTSSGNRSWHSVNRAVDVPPRADVFRWIHDNFFAGTRELIWGGSPSQNIHNGRYHRYSDSLLLQHGPYKGKSGPSPHIHWAYDSGGMLPPGVTTVVNNTGRPEPVLSPGQWDTIAALARNSHAEPRQNIFHFQKADLDLGRLRAIEDRQSAQARVGRPG